MTDCRNTYRWKQLRKRMVAAAQLCQLCGIELLHRASQYHPQYPQLDHIIELMNGGDQYDPWNLRVVCRRCNTSRGATAGNRTRNRPNITHPINHASRVW